MRGTPLVVAALLTPGLALSYEVGTHALVTIYAVNQSQVSSLALQQQLGIDVFTVPVQYRERPFNASYFDVGQDLRLREVIDSYEKPLLPVSGPNFDVRIDNLTITGWLARGAIREDDNPIEFRAYDDPVNAARPFNHFFDPAHNLPLTLGGANDGVPLLGAIKNPDWALGTTDAFQNPSGIDPLRQNHFSIPDAREAMWRALTLYGANGTPLEDLGGLTRENARKAYWATTFRALGDAVHMIQDLTQPQHARNEPHSGIGSHEFQARFTGHGSVIENYTESRALKRPVTKNTDFGGGAVTITFNGKPLPALDTFPTIPRFNRFIDYFSTSPNSTTNPGLGVADFTNRFFFSSFKNLGFVGMALPSSDVNQYAPCTLPLFGWDDQLEADGVMTDMLCSSASHPIVDPVSNASLVGFPVTAQSAWDKFLNLKSVPGTYQLNRTVYDRQVEYLLPRAAAYSAGLLDYFFRGRMQIELPASGVYAILDHATLAGDNKPPTDVNGFKGFKKIRLKLKNTTSDITPTGSNSSPIPQVMGPGRLVAVLKFRRNACYSDDLANAQDSSCRSSVEEIVSSNAQNVSEVGTTAQEMTFDFQTEIPINITDAYLQVVFRGHLGDEADAVAVGFKDISEPTYASYFNATDMIWLDGQLRTRDDIAGNADLRAKITVPNCLDAQNLLRSDCLLPQDHMATTVALTTPGIGSISVALSDLPLRRYLRFAYLTDRDAAQSLSQTGDCVYQPQPVAPTFEQQESVTGPASTNLTFSQYQPTRGIKGWSALTCVLRADDRPYPDANQPLPGMTNIDSGSRPVVLTMIPES